MSELVKAEDAKRLSMNSYDRGAHDALDSLLETLRDPLTAINLGLGNDPKTFGALAEVFTRFIENCRSGLPPRPPAPLAPR